MFTYGETRERVEACHAGILIKEKLLQAKCETCLVMCQISQIDCFDIPLIIIRAETQTRAKTRETGDAWDRRQGSRDGAQVKDYASGVEH